MESLAAEQRRELEKMRDEKREMERVGEGSYLELIRPLPHPSTWFAPLGLVVAALQQPYYL